jgi:hypothetical protein
MNRYALLDLGGLVAGGTCFPGAVQVVSGDVQATGMADTSGPALDAFIYRKGSMADLGISIGGNGFGMAMNRLGDVAGALSPTPGSAFLTAFVKKAGGANIFPSLPNKLGIYPLSINDAGDVAGRYVGSFSGPESGGWYCLDGEQAVDLTVTVNSDILRASQINNARKLVGETNSGSFFVYDVMAQTLQTLPLTTALLSEDRNIFINNSGQMAANAAHGPVFLQNGNTIPMSPPNQGSIMLRGLNDSGQVIFTPLNHFDDQGLAFVSDGLAPSGTAAPAIYNVNDYLDAPGWRVTQLTGIASDGSLVGSGVLGGDSRGILLMPKRAPLPWTAAFVRILFGIIQDGGGAESPGGHVPPRDPWAMVASSLNPGQKDVLTGFAVHALAGRIVDPVARHEIQARATALIQQAAPRMNVRGTVELPGGKSAPGTRGASTRDPQRFQRLFQPPPNKK